MDAKQMLDLVSRFEKNRDFISNEETAKMALVVPFVQFLGYDTGNPREVRLEYAADFVQGDGKRYPDRMDFAVFDRSGANPLLVIETKPLGTDLRAHCQQLARYIAQMPGLHFGIITDGCHFLFYGDLEAPNSMDGEPFFNFSLDDAKADWGKIATFLTKFSREAFNAETLVTDAENSRYRQAMIEKLATALRSPQTDESFLKWLTDDVYPGNRTAKAMARLGEVAKEAIEPALLRIMSDDFLTKLRRRIDSLNTDQGGPEESTSAAAEGAPADEAASADAGSGVETTEEEIGAFKIVQAICCADGEAPGTILYKDTINYFNVSYKHPTKWFIRFFSRGSKKSIVTRLPLEEAQAVVDGFEVEEAPAAFGASRVYIDDATQILSLKDLVLRSLASARSDKAS